MDEPLLLPEDAELEYLNEGAANVVYRIKLPPATPEPELSEEYGSGTPAPSEIGPDRINTSIFSNTLLRLRKNTPTTLPNLKAQHLWKIHIRPLIPTSNTVTQTLITLPAHLISKLNTQLLISETSLHPRPQKRQGTYLAPSSHGLLVTDMSPQNPSEVVIEFKPKWLLPSPSAPGNSNRCRECALKGSKPLKSHQRPWCPLSFFVENLTSAFSISRLAREIIRSNFPDAKDGGVDVDVDVDADLDWPGYEKALTHWLKTNTLLPLLRSLQARLDAKGILNLGHPAQLSEETKLDVSLAMTLRDCTIFLRFADFEIDEEGERDGEIGGDVNGNGNAKKGKRVVECRIGDLDVKSVDKWGYWVDTERGLLEGGYYGLESEICCLSKPKPHR